MRMGVLVQISLAKFVECMYPSHCPVFLVMGGPIDSVHSPDVTFDSQPEDIWFCILAAL